MLLLPSSCIIACSRLPCVIPSSLFHPLFVHLHSIRFGGIAVSKQNVFCNCSSTHGDPSFALFPNQGHELDKPFLQLDHTQEEMMLSVSDRICDTPDNKCDDGDRGGDVEELVLMQALETRRFVTAEIIKESLISGRFSLNYAINLVSLLPDFITLVMFEASLMKKFAVFSSILYNDRVKALIIRSKFVRFVRWMEDNSIHYTKIAKLICMSRGKFGKIQNIIEWLKFLNVQRKFIGHVLTNSGDNILERNLEELNDIFDFLESTGVRREWMGTVISRCPQLLSYNKEEIIARVDFYLNMGMTENIFGKIIFSYPESLGYWTLEEMKQKVNYLKQLGLNDNDVILLLARQPRLMGCSIENRWKPLLKYFYYHGIGRDGMRKILIRKPEVFCLELDTIVAPKVKFLKDIGIVEDAVGEILVSFPNMLTFSLDKKIWPVVKFLTSKAGVSKQNVRKVIGSSPEILGNSIEQKLEVNARYFLSLGISLEQLGEMIVNFPPLLRYNINIFRPKYNYFKRIMILPLQDLIQFPRYMSYSLEERIMPRHKILVQKHINLSLRHMLACSNDEFEKRVQAAECNS